MTDQLEHDAMESCDGVMAQLWDYLDHELTEARMAEVRAHLAVCTRCFPQYDFERRFLAAVRAARDERPAPEHLQGRVLAVLRDGMPDL